MMLSRCSFVIMYATTVAAHVVPPWSLAGFTISPEDIARFEANPESLKSWGGLKGVAMSLRVDPAKGIEGGPDDIKLRTEAFGANTYPIKKPKLFLVSVIRSLSLFSST